MTRLRALVITCAPAVPSFGQQKTFKGVPGNDETVSLDPGYYHGGPSFQASARAKDVRVDIDAQLPVTISLLSTQQWSDAAQHPETLRHLKSICDQEHVVKATYICTPPPGLPVVIVVRDERASEQGVFFGIGEVIARHDRSGQNPDRAVSAGLETPLTARRVRELVTPNIVHLQYYDWSCTDHCNLPDPAEAVQLGSCR
jgi:hypothetical protein